MVLDLSRGMEYQVRVQALTVNGTGPATEWYYSETYLHDLDGKFVMTFCVSYWEIKTYYTLNFIFKQYLNNLVSVCIQGSVTKYGNQVWYLKV